MRRWICALCATNAWEMMSIHLQMTLWTTNEKKMEKWLVILARSIPQKHTHTKKKTRRFSLKWYTPCDWQNKQTYNRSIYIELTQKKRLCFVRLFFSIKRPCFELKATFHTCTYFWWRWGILFERWAQYRLKSIFDSRISQIQAQS